MAEFGSRQRVVWELFEELGALLGIDDGVPLLSGRRLG